MNAPRWLVLAGLLSAAPGGRAGAAGTGLHGDYFDNRSFSGTPATRTDATIDFTWTGAPGPSGIGADDFSVRWEGRVEAVVSGEHTFYVTADDGARLWVDNQLLCGRVSYSAANKEIAGGLRLEAGQRYNLRLEFLESSGTAAVKLEWSAPGLPREVVPTAQLYASTANPERGGLLMEQWNGLSGSAITTLTSNANYPDRPSERDILPTFECLARNVDDSYGTRVSGYIKPRASGSYTFAVAADDTAELWLSTDASSANKEKIVTVDSWTAFRDFTHVSGAVTLSADSKYYVELRHKENTGGDHFSVAWKKPGSTTFAVIDGDELVPAGLTTARPAFGTYLDTLARGHPRVLISQARIERLKALVASGDVAKVNAWWGSVQDSADAILTQPVNEWISGDLLEVCRSVMSRVYTLAVAYHVTGDADYAERAWDELSAAGNFPDWDPDKFLCVAEMTHAFAIGYDWLYDYWSTSRRDTLRARIRAKGLDQGLAHLDDWYFQSDANNWGLVCNGGLALGALAIGKDDGGDESAVETTLHNCWTRILPVMRHYTTDNGAWYEGASYWAYGVQYLVRMMAALQTALGSDFSLANVDGIDQLGQFPAHLNGARGSAWNFADDSSGDSLSSDQLFWLARRFNRLDYAWLHRAKGGGSALGLLWYEAGGQDPVADPRPRENWFRGAAGVTDFKGQEIVTMRSAWQNSQAAYLGVKGGTPGESAHGNLDAGTFYFEALGVTWAWDLGHDDYGLPGYFDGGSSGQRWDYYRCRAEGQNTLVIGNSSAPEQVLGSVNPIITFATQPASERALAVVDMSGAYSGSTRVWRGVQLLNRRRHLLIQDEIVLPTAKDVWWFMHIWLDKSVAIQPDASEVILTQGSKRLWIKIISGGGAFQLRGCTPMDTSPDPAGQNPNTGQKKLGIRFTGVTSKTLAVYCVPLNSGEDPPATMPEIVPLRDWRTVGNDPPAARAPPDRTVNQNTGTGAIGFTVEDDITDPANLTLGKLSSNTALVPTANIVLGGSGSNRTVTITPASNHSGVATISLTVSDGDLVTTSRFVLTVNGPPTATGVSVTTNEDHFVDVDLRALATDALTADSNLLFAVTGASNGTVTLLADGHTARFVPNTNFNGAARFSYIVTDLGQDSRLFLHYSFEPPDTLSRLEVDDNSGHGRDGSVEKRGAGDAAYSGATPDALGPCSAVSLRLTESGDGDAARLVRLIPPDELDLGAHDWTFAGWFQRLASTNDDFLFYLGGGDGFGGGGEQLQLYGPSGQNRLAVRHYDATNALDALIDSGGGVDVGDWHHAAVTFDAGTANGGVLKLYLDGAMVGGVSNLAFALDQTLPTVFGGHNNPGFQSVRWFNGRLDDLALFDNDLSASDVARLAARTVAHFGGLADTATVSVTVAAVNDAPALAAISNHILGAGQTMAVTNIVTDADLPAQTLTFSLLQRPTGAVIGAASGLLTWRPAVAQADSTNVFRVRVADNGSPIMAATQQFNVVVRPLAAASVANPSTSNGQFRATIIGDTGPDYAVQASTNLIDWSPLFATNSPALPHPWSDPSSPTFPRRFYRTTLGP